MGLVKRIALAALLAVIAAPLSAQNFAEIIGTVTDSTGAVIAGANVTATNLATGVSRETQTNASGNYAFPRMNPGNYQVTAESEGFKQALQDNWVLQTGDTARIDFAMEIGAVTEVIEVEAGAQMIQTANTALGTVIEQKRIEDLPINGRNYLNLVKLSPNVSAEMGAGGQANSRQGGERANQAISVAGMRQQYNRFTLDGVENTDPNFNTFIVRPSVDALQEFKVQTGIYSAEYGKSPSQINVTTRSGGNEIHGTLFEFLRNDKIQANPWLNESQNPLRRNQFGFTATGPIVKNKVFWMANYEGFRERVQRVRRSTVADRAMRGGDFTGPAIADIYDPDTRLADPATSSGFTAERFANNTIPVSRHHPIFQQMYEFYPEPNIAGAVTGIDGFNYQRNASNPLDWDQFTTRIDFNESSTSQWFGRYSWGSEELVSGQNFEFRDERITTDVYQIMVSNTRTFGAAIVNEARFGFNHFNNDKLTFFNGIRDVTSELGIIGLDDPGEASWGTPQMSFEGLNVVSGWGEQTGGPFLNRNRTWQFLDNLSWIKGNHTFKTGFEFARRHYGQLGNQFPRGNLQFGSRYTADPNDLSGTGDAFAGGLLGLLVEATRAPGTPDVNFRQNSFSAYFEDQWRVTPKATLTLGLRYEYTPPFQDKFRQIMNVEMFCPGVDETGIDEGCQTPILTRPGPSTDFNEDLSFRLADFVPVQSGDDVMFNHALIQKDTNDFAPRIGLAYQLSSKTSLRTGGGIFYAQDTGNPIFDMGRNFGNRDTAVSRDPIPTSFLSAPWANKAGGECSGWDGACFNGLYTFGNTARRKTPYVAQYMFNLQHQLTDTLLLEAGYSGSKGTKLQRMYGFNTPTERAGPDDASTVNQRRPWGGDIFGRIQTIANVVNSNYNALGVKVQQRFNKGFTYLIGYTWAKSIDNGSAIRTNSGDNLFPASSYDLRPERGPSQFDTKQRLTASILYELPLSFENRLVEALAGGWQMGSIFTFSGGTPVNGGNCGDLNGNIQGNRGDLIGPVNLDNPTAQEFYAKRPLSDPNFPGGAAGISCIVDDPSGVNALRFRQGNRTRNIFRSPGVGNWDFSMMKNFRFTESANLQFRFESFNFSNHPNWNTPNTNPRNRNFGIITSARAMRTNQFALKFMF